MNDMKRNLRDILKKTTGTTEPSMEQVDDLMNQAKKYEGRSESDLLNELIANYKKGTLSDQDLERFANQAGPMLNPEQRKKLKSIIDRLHS